MNIEQILQAHVKKAFKDIYNLNIDKAELQATRKDFEGDLTLVVFPYVKQLRKNPKEVAEKIGEFLQKNVPEVAGFNVVVVFLIYLSMMLIIRIF